MSSAGKSDKGSSTGLGCGVKGCKGNEHFEHFKFGLIKKNGEQVFDYDKKLGHYQAYVERQKTRKVA
jgi:hypothetical protein